MDHKKLIQRITMFTVPLDLLMLLYTMFCLINITLFKLQSIYLIKVSGNHFLALVYIFVTQACGTLLALILYFLVNLLNLVMYWKELGFPVNLLACLLFILAVPLVFLVKKVSYTSLKLSRLFDLFSIIRSLNAVPAVDLRPATLIQSWEEPWMMRLSGDCGDSDVPLRSPDWRKSSSVQFVWR